MVQMSFNREKDRGQRRGERGGEGGEGGRETERENILICKPSIKPGLAVKVLSLETLELCSEGFMTK